MSYQNAHRNLFEFVIDKQYAFPRFENINAVVEASRQNTTIRAELLPRTGKNRQIDIFYYPVDCDAVNDTCSNGLCPTGEKLEPISESFIISRCIESTVALLDTDDIRNVDGEWDFSAHAMAIMNAKLGSVRKQLSLDIDTLMYANKGVHLNGQPTQRLQLTNNSNGQLNPWGLWQIEKEFADGGYTNPYVLGSTEVFQWRKSLGIATANNTTGMDYSRLGDTNLFYDVNLNQVTGSTPSTGEHVLAFDPQAIKFVSYNENVGIFATELQSIDQLDRLFKQGGTNYMRGVMPDPLAGILWDFYLKFDDCTNQFTFFIRLRWDIFFPKIQSCNGQGVNGIFDYTTCPLVVEDCPTGQPVSPVLAQTTYQWNPGFAYPLYVQNSIIGGVKSDPKVNVTTDAETVAMLNGAYAGQATFTLVGANIQYTGFSPITVSLNDGNVTGTFTAV